MVRSGSIAGLTTTASAEAASEGVSTVDPDAHRQMGSYRASSGFEGGHDDASNVLAKKTRRALGSSDQPARQSRCQRTVLTCGRRSARGGRGRGNQATAVWRRRNCDGSCVRVHERGGTIWPRGSLPAVTTDDRMPPAAV